LSASSAARTRTATGAWTRCAGPAAQCARPRAAQPPPRLTPPAPCRPQREFSELVKAVNPGASLTEAALGLIQGEVWAALPRHVTPRGLTPAGLASLYADGLADLGRDYGEWERAEAAAAPARAPAAQPAAVAGVHRERAARGAAAPAAPPPAAASPAPPGSAARGAGGDVFEFLKTPAPPPRRAADSDDDASPAVAAPASPAEGAVESTLCFALLLAGVRSEAELDAAGLRAAVGAALAAALPEGAAPHVAGAVPTPGGLALAVEVAMPPAAAASEETAYLASVLATDPAQIFPPSAFGRVEALGADGPAAGSARAAARGAAAAAAAAATAGAAGAAALGFSLLLPGCEERGFRRARGERLVAALREALPPLAAARVTRVAAAPGGLVVTVAASAPAEALEELRAFHRALRADAAAALDTRAFADAAVVASRLCVAPRPALGLHVRLPEQRPGRGAAPPGAAADWREELMAEALSRALPEGARAAVTGTIDSPRGMVVALAASLPPGAGAAEVAAAAETAADAAAWVPAAVLAAAGGIRAPRPRCERVARALEPAFGARADAAFAFGMPGCRVQARSPSPEKGRRSPGFFGRLLSRGGASPAPALAAPPARPGSAFGDDATLASPAAARPLSTGLAASPAAARPLSAGLAAAAAAPMSPPDAAVLAGYQRRGTPSSGESSAGLGDAVAAASEAMAECSVRDGERARVGVGAAGLAATAAAAIAAAEALSPSKGGGAGGGEGAAPRAVLVHAYATDEDEEAERAPLARGLAAAEAASPAPARLLALAPSPAPSASLASRRPPPLAIPADGPAPGGAAPTPLAALVEGPPAAHRAAAGPPSPWDEARRAAPAEWAAAAAQLDALVAALQAVLDDPSKGTAEVAAALDAAATAPPRWARHEACMRLGERLGAAGLFPEALASFRRAAAAWPEGALAYFRVGNAHFALHQYRDAARAFFSALKRCPAEGDPLRVKIHINMGIALESEGKVAAAAREYARGAAAAPRHPRVHKLLGSARLALGEAEGAVEALTAALEVAPGFADAWADLGAAYAALGDAPAARRCFDAALRHAPGHAEARFNLGNLHRAAGAHAEALAAYDAVLAADPGHWRALLAKAVALELTGAGAPAAAHLKAALALSGRGSELAAEVAALRALLAAGAGGAAVAAQVGAVDAAARAAAAGSPLPGAPGAPAPSPFAGAPGFSPRAVAASPFAAAGASSPSRAGSPERAASVRSGYSGRSNTPSVLSVAHSVRSVRSARSGRAVLGAGAAAAARAAPPPRQASPTRTPERMASWRPMPGALTEADFGPDVAAALVAAGLPPAEALAALDVPFLQRLVPVAALRPAAIWREALALGEALAPPAPSPNRRSNAPGAPPSPTRGDRLRAAKALSPAAAEALLCRLLARAPPHLAGPCLDALGAGPMSLLARAGGGRVDAALLLLVLGAATDAPKRERLDLLYKLLMWRGAEPGRENPVTRRDLVDALTALKAVFEPAHAPGVLAAPRPARPGDAAFVMFERFAADVGKFFPALEALPLLAAPLH
jgi:tetratricopeptide (TPR) repeat protein